MLPAPPKTKEGPCFGSSKWLLEPHDGGPSSPTATSTPCSLHESQAGEPHLHPGFASLAPRHPTPLERQPWRAPGKASVTELAFPVGAGSLEKVKLFLLLFHFGEGREIRARIFADLLDDLLLLVCADSKAKQHRNLVGRMGTCALVWGCCRPFPRTWQPGSPQHPTLREVPNSGNAGSMQGRCPDPAAHCL